MISSPRRLLTVVTLVMLWCAAGCAARPPVVATPPGQPSGLRFTGKGRIELARESHRFEAALAVRGPDRLVIEIAGPIGGTRAVLALRGGDVIVLLPAERAYIAEPADATLFEALIGLPMDGASLVRMMSFAADAPDGEEALFAGVRLAREEGSLVATPSGPSAGRFRRLTLRVRDVARVPPESLAEALFAPMIPAGWTRLDPGSAQAGEPLLLP